MCLHVEMREPLSRVNSSLSPLCWTTVSYLSCFMYCGLACLHASGWSSCLHLPFHCRNARITNAARALTFLCQFQGLNSSYRAPVCKHAHSLSHLAAMTWVWGKTEFHPNLKMWSWLYFSIIIIESARLTFNPTNFDLYLQKVKLKF